MEKKMTGSTEEPPVCNRDCRNCRHLISQTLHFRDHPEFTLPFWICGMHDDAGYGNIDDMVDQRCSKPCRDWEYEEHPDYDFNTLGDISLIK